MPIFASTPFTPRTLFEENRGGVGFDPHPRRSRVKMFNFIEKYWLRVFHCRLACLVTVTSSRVRQGMQNLPPPLSPPRGEFGRIPQSGGRWLMESVSAVQVTIVLHRTFLVNIFIALAHAFFLLPFQNTAYPQRTRLCV